MFSYWNISVTVLEYHYFETVNNQSRRCIIHNDQNYMEASFDGCSISQQTHIRRFGYQV